MWKALGFVLVAAVAWSAPALAQDESEEEKKKLEIMGYQRINLLEPSLVGVELDSTRWLQLGPGVSGCRIVGESNAWAARYTWYRLSTAPTELIDIEELNELETEGKIDTTMRLIPATYTKRISGGSRESAARAALAAYDPPSALYAAIQEDVDRRNEALGISTQKSGVRIIRPGN